MKLGVMVRICKVFLVHNSQKAVSPAKMIFLALDCFVLFQLVISLSFDKFAALCKSRGEKGSIHETWLRPKIYMGRLNFLAWWVNFWTWVKSDLPPEICVTRKKKDFFLSFHESLKILRFECSHPKLVAPWMLLKICVTREFFENETESGPRYSATLIWTIYGCCRSYVRISYSS